MENKRAVVTGGAGFIGSHLVEELVANGYQVAVLDDLSTGKKANIEPLLPGGRVDFVRGSVTDLPLLQELFQNTRYVFHLAAISSVPRSLKDPRASHEVNATGTLNVVLASRDNNVSKVIYASSSAVYGDTPTLPQKEDMVPRPLSPYAAAKLAGEHYYGYWITRSAHRIPNANPSQDPTALPRVAAFFTSLDEESANKIAQELGSAYVVLDYETASSKFWAVATWAGKPPTDFFANYWSPAENSQRTYIHTDYYRSLSTRLYNFDGKAVKPEKTLVIAYELRTTVDGLEYRELLSEKEFISYEEAEAYIASQKSGNYKIVGTDPLLSPVPLEELKQYKLVYSSEETVASNHGPIPAVKVFEFTDRVSPYKP